MKSKKLRFTEGFRVAFDGRDAQAAEMVIAPGDSEGGSDNRHRGADQWLYVVSGSGEAVVGHEHIELTPGRLLLIERGERHVVRNTGDVPLATLNFYVPPAFAADGEPLPPGRS